MEKIPFVSFISFFLLIFSSTRQQLVDLYANKDKQLLEEYDVMSFEQRTSQLQAIATEAEDKGKTWSKHGEDIDPKEIIFLEKNSVN